MLLGPFRSSLSFRDQLQPETSHGQMILLVQGQAKTYDLKSGDNVLGRLPDCDIQIDSNMVSRKHARVFSKGTDF